MSPSPSSQRRALRPVDRNDFAAVVAQRDEARADIRRAHERLDQEDVPRNDDAGKPLSLALRIAVLAWFGPRPGQPSPEADRPRDRLGGSPPSEPDDR